MNPLLYLIYRLLKGLVLLCFRIFYRKTVILHRENLRVGPSTIVVSNHPSTMTDPLNAAARVESVVFFLANASMFKHWFTNWFFNTFYCIPIERPKDVAGRRISNEESFARCDEFLSGGGCLYIAPEGVSNMGRRLQELKTGTARIALSAESKNDFQLKLNILPVGLHYSALTEFRSDVLINVGPPMAIAPYREHYRKDPIAAVRQVTADLEAGMRSLIIETKDEAEEEVLGAVEKMSQAVKPLSFEEQFFRSKKLLPKIQQVRKNDPVLFAQWQDDLKAFSQMLTMRKTNHEAFYQVVGFGKKSSANLFFFILGFPFFLYGWTNNFLGNFFPGLLARTLPLYLGYRSTVKLLSALILYPLFYGLQLWLVQKLFDQWWITLIYFLSLYPLGIFAWRYRQRLAQWQKKWQMQQWRKKQPEEVNAFYEVQQKILSQLQA